MAGVVYDIIERKTGELYQCMPQMLDLNGDGRYVLRYNIGIEGYSDWSFVCAIYSNDEFNQQYDVIRARTRR